MQRDLQWMTVLLVAAALCASLMAPADPPLKARPQSRRCSLSWHDISGRSDVAQHLNLDGLRIEMSRAEIERKLGRMPGPFPTVPCGPAMPREDAVSFDERGFVRAIAIPNASLRWDGDTILDSRASLVSTRHRLDIARMLEARAAHLIPETELILFPSVVSLKAGNIYLDVWSNPCDNSNVMIAGEHDPTPLVQCLGLRLLK